MNSQIRNTPPDKFEQNMKNLEPSIRFADEDKQAIKMHLQFYMRARKRRPPVALLVSAFALVVLMLVPSGPPLIGDSFDMEATGGVYGGSRAFETYQGDTRIGVPDNPDFTEDETKNLAATMNQQYASQEADLYMVTGWRVNEHTAYLHHYKYHINSETIETTRDSGDASPENIKAVFEYLIHNEKRFLALKENDSLPMQREGIVYRDGVKFQMKSWTMDDPGFGNITYWEGFPVN